MLALGQEITLESLEQVGLVSSDRRERVGMVQVPLRRGEASLHSFLTVHQSGPNTKSYPRVGLALRFIARDVIQTGNE